MTKRFLKLLAKWPTTKALVLACLLGLAALSIMVAGVVLSTPLAVVASMSVAQGFTVLSILLFGFTVSAEALAARQARKDAGG